MRSLFGAWSVLKVESKLLQYDNLLARCLRLENALTSERGNTTASIPQCRVFTYLRIYSKSAEQSWKKSSGAEWCPTLPSFSRYISRTYLITLILTAVISFSLFVDDWGINSAEFINIHSWLFESYFPQRKQTGRCWRKPGLQVFSSIPIMKGTNGGLTVWVKFFEVSRDSFVYVTECNVVVWQDESGMETGMGSRQFCRGREVEAEARQGSNVLNRGKAEAESSRPRRGRLNSRQGRGEATPEKILIPIDV